MLLCESRQQDERIRFRLQAQNLFHLSLPGLLAARHQRTSPRGALYGSSGRSLEFRGSGFLGLEV